MVRVGIAGGGRCFHVGSERQWLARVRAAVSRMVVPPCAQPRRLQEASARKHANPGERGVWVDFADVVSYFEDMRHHRTVVAESGRQRGGPGLKGSL